MLDTSRSRAWWTRSLLACLVLGGALVALAPSVAVAQEEAPPVEAPAEAPAPPAEAPVDAPAPVVLETPSPAPVTFVTRAPLAEPCAPPPVCCPPPLECDPFCITCRKPAKPTCPVKYQNLRFRENWKPCLCVPRCDRGDWTDMLKAVPVGSWFRLDVGGQIRFRYEHFRNQRLVEGNTDGWLLGRFRLHTDMHFWDVGRVFVEGIYADQWTRDIGPRAIDINQGDLLNAFLELAFPVGPVKLGGAIGRRELQYGKQRLISPLDWANTRRTFQGAYGWIEKGFQRLDGFLTRPVIPLPYEFDEWNSQVGFWGGYYTNKVKKGFEWELFFLGLYRENGAYFSATKEEMRYTAGGRMTGVIPGSRFDYDLVGGYQFGGFGNDSISAGFATVDFSWTPCVRCWDPKVTLGFDYASGDQDPTDDTQGTFNQLYPLAHAYLGFADLLARQNILCARARVTAKPMDKLTLLAEYLGFWRDSADDAVYFVTGGILRPPGGSDSLYTGAELDLRARWTPDRHWRVDLGWSHFFTGTFLADTGPGADLDFFWAEVQWTF